jgi:hypothetical protein
LRAGSSKSVRIVEKKAPSTPVANRSSEARIALGSVIDSASARQALRTWPIAAAAWSPWPAMSPTANATVPSGRSTMSYQSPPTCTPRVAGR